MQPLNVVALPAFADNYIWMLHDGMQAVVVDPGDARPVIDTLDRLTLELAGILVTHHHSDHVGGVDALRPRLRGQVFGPASETIPEPYVPLREGDCVAILGLGFDVLEVPGHTRGHIAYVARPEAQPPILLCGDTLFSGGCGRLFEGTPAQMHHSLTRLAALAPDTRVYCTHEYTLSNLAFAHAVEPDNTALADYTTWCRARRAEDLPTLPSTISLEREINPFLRTHVPAVVEAAHRRGATSDAPVDVLAALRQWKNQF